MALLTTYHGWLASARRRGRWTLAALLALSVAGCFVLDALGLREQPLAFSHARHAEEGLDCSDCHASYDEGDVAKPISANQCALCHADLDASKAPERQVASLFTEGTFHAAQVTTLPGEVLFSHQWHLGAGVSCNECHRGIDENERVDASLSVGMLDCQACHATHAVEDECSVCHTEVSRETAPGNHEREWKRLHGLAVRAQLDGPANDCALCHSDQTCTTCHQDEKPRNHNNLWRLRAHGVVAAMDRDNCAACHQPSSCDRCHAETLPLSHKGMFGSGLNTHCLGCHIPVQNESCVVCHKSTPGHLMAAPKPPGHTAAMDCRSCHGVSEALPHVDNGDNCNFCHF